MNQPIEQPQDDDPGAVRGEFAGATEISRRVGSILDAVEEEAQRQRDEAREEARRYLVHAMRQADALVAERRRRIAAVSDELLAKAEAVAGRLDDAAPVRQGFENLVRALGDAAERLAREAHAVAADGEPPPFHDLADVPVPTRSEPLPPPPVPAPEPSQPARPLGFAGADPAADIRRFRT